MDGQGRYRRFVVQQVTLDALLERVDDRRASIPREELLFEAAAVLAGTILMASGTSGGSPAAHDSTTTLSTLLPQIAAYRDAFYQQLFAPAQRNACRAADGGNCRAAPAVRRGPAASQRPTRPPPGVANAACPFGAAVRAAGISRGGRAAIADRAGRFGADDLPDSLPDDGRASGGRPRPAGRWRLVSGADRRPVASRHRMRGDRRSVEHLGFRRPVQLVPGRRKQHSRLARR